VQIHFSTHPHGLLTGERIPYMTGPGGNAKLPISSGKYYNKSIKKCKKRKISASKAVPQILAKIIFISVISRIKTL